MARMVAVRAALHDYSSALVVMPGQRSAATVIEGMSTVVIVRFQHVKKPDRFVGRSDSHLSAKNVH